jgi:hypothetical protein
MRVLSPVLTAAWCGVIEREGAAGFALSMAFIAFSVGCGGSQATGAGVQSANTAGGSASALGVGTNAPQSPDATTTTTETLRDAGDMQGTKLAEQGTSMSTSTRTPLAPRQPHAHDPGRGPDDIRAIIIAHRDEARACYDNALTDHPGMEGDLVVSWTVDPRGSVSEIGLDVSRSQITEATVVACVSEIVRKIQFPASPGGFETKASYPFNFRPRRGRSAQ